MIYWFKKRYFFNFWMILAICCWYFTKFRFAAKKKTQFFHIRLISSNMPFPCTIQYQYSTYITIYHLNLFHISGQKCFTEIFNLHAKFICVVPIEPVNKSQKKLIGNSSRLMLQSCENIDVLIYHRGWKSFEQFGDLSIRICTENIKNDTQRKYN